MRIGCFEIRIFRSKQNRNVKTEMSKALAGEVHSKTADAIRSMSAKKTIESMKFVPVLDATAPQGDCQAAETEKGTSRTTNQSLKPGLSPIMTREKWKEVGSYRSSRSREQDEGSREMRPSDPSKDRQSKTRSTFQADKKKASHTKGNTSREGAGKKNKKAVPLSRTVSPSGNRG